MRFFSPLFALILLCACSGAPHVVRPEVTGAPPAHRLYLVSHGWHTGLVVPAAALNRALPALAERFGRPAFYEIGWGDKDFYRARARTAGLALQALFWSTGAVIHVVAVPDSPYESFPRSNILDTCVSDAELAALTRFVSNSFSRDRSGQIVALAAGLYGDGQFYDGAGRFCILNTCNKWTAKGLRSAGHDVSPTFQLTAGSVVDYLADNRRACAQPAERIGPAAREAPPAR